MRWTPVSAESGRVSERVASAIRNGSSTSSASATDAACCAAVASLGTASAVERSLTSARSAASFTSGKRRRESSDIARRSASRQETRLSIVWEAPTDRRDRHRHQAQTKQLALSKSTRVLVQFLLPRN
eukprot:3100353-Prymnesium_polylepis.1